MSTKFFSLPEV